MLSNDHDTRTSREKLTLLHNALYEWLDKKCLQSLNFLILSFLSIQINMEIFNVKFYAWYIHNFVALFGGTN